MEKIKTYSPCEKKQRRCKSNTYRQVYGAFKHLSYGLIAMLNLLFYSFSYATENSPELDNLPLVYQNTASKTSQLETFFNQATKAYNASNYELAKDYYERILAAGYQSAELYYNLGNVYYKQSEIAYSIYYFEKSLLLNPDDQEVIKNLNFAKKMTLDAIPVKEVNGIGKAYLKTISAKSMDQWAVICIAHLILAGLLYLLYYFSQNSLKKRILFSCSLLMLLLGGASYLNAYLVGQEADRDQPAIVFETAKVLSEPNPSGVQVFELHQGTKVQLLESYANWHKIQISDGQTGWLLQNQIKQIKD